ncbi:hypothetical protein G7Z17_g10727 [Cylindrodendrum hubeiense]|uniref:Uncharacterized protein n=1 Tax=Cylindrodendrum hubeiense TaxID=595255 RepID=A0A9P5H1L8_9HYPO|nr:hypothetical protein G7Z17_g10727 [Cylindrodendrum hubeiense]
MNGARTMPKQSYLANPPMRKSLADVGSGGQSHSPRVKKCEPYQASEREDYLRYTTEDTSTKAYEAYKANITTCYPQSPSPSLSPSPFTQEDQIYLYHRLPLQRPTTAQTTRLHFSQLTFVYQDLADRSLARAATMVPGLARERRQRMGVLATRLAKRYCGCKIVLSDRFVESVLSRHADGLKRPSRFWETVLDEVERANASWSLARLWILFCVIQSALVIFISWLLPPTAQSTLMVANALADIWSAAVLWERVHARYFATKGDEQELHDLMGGL